MAAIFAASEGAETLLLERTNDGGRKILISGGGRCNILPARVDESRFVTDSSPHLLRHMLRSWPLREQIAFFERELELPLVEEAESGKLFPKSQRARDVRDKLLAYARLKGVGVISNALVTGVRPSGDRWIVERQDGEPIEGDAVILATGGLSVPNTGSDGRGLLMAAQLGHTVNSTYAALTPLVSKRGREGFSTDSREEPSRPLFGELAGVSLPVTITARAETREARATGGFLVHPSRLQRAVRPRRVARRGSIARGRRLAGAHHGAVDALERRRLGSSAASARHAHRARRCRRRAATPPGRSTCRARPRSTRTARSRNLAEPSACG